VPYCQHCGVGHPDDATFCPSCGSWVGSVGGLPQATAPAAARYAGFWARVGAWLLDQLVIGIPYNVLTAVFVSYKQPSLTSTTDASGKVTMHWNGDWGTFGLLILAGVIVAWLYTSLLLSSPRQATVGKMALGLVVTDEAGQRISFARASGRYFAGTLNSLTLGIGYLMVIWTGRKQALHDKIAGTLVVPKPS
jgi:uncharacterized RDD family membrane protein YckC